MCGNTQRRCSLFRAQLRPAGVSCCVWPHTHTHTHTMTSPPPLPTPPPTPPRITFRPICASTLPSLKSLNAALFPVAYRDIFYAQCMAAGDLTHGAFDGGELVGAVAVRLEARGEEEGGADAYVMTVGVLAPYRGRGIGEKLWRREGCKALAKVITFSPSSSPSPTQAPTSSPTCCTARQPTPTFTRATCTSRCARERERERDPRTHPFFHALSHHPQTSNDEAIAFYTRLGFEAGDVVRGYYRRLTPPRRSCTTAAVEIG